MPKRPGEDRSSQVNFGTGPRLVAYGGVLTALAAFLPWLKVSGGASASGSGSVTVQVLSGKILGTGLVDVSPVFSGALTGAIGLVTVGLALGATNNDSAQLVEIVLGVIVAVVGIVHVAVPGVALGSSESAKLLANFSSPSIGIFATIGGGALIAVGGVLGARNVSSGDVARDHTTR